jgi:hypothetical protein
MHVGRNAAGPLPAMLPSIRLRRRQMVWVLGQLGYGAGVSATTFYEYIKSLRKLGIPFEFYGQIASKNARGIFVQRRDGACIDFVVAHLSLRP